MDPDSHSGSRASLSATCELPAVTRRRVWPRAFTRCNKGAARSSPGQTHKPQSVRAHRREATRTALTGPAAIGEAEARQHRGERSDASQSATPGVNDAGDESERRAPGTECSTRRTRGANARCTARYTATVLGPSAPGSCAQVDLTRRAQTLAKRSTRTFVHNTPASPGVNDLQRHN
jgi:hypothetical protein